MSGQSSLQQLRQSCLPLSSGEGQGLAGYAHADLVDAGLQRARACLLGTGLAPTPVKALLSQAGEAIGAALEAAGAVSRLTSTLAQPYDSGKARSIAIANLADEICQAAARGAAGGLAGTPIAGRKKLRAEFAEAVRNGVRDKVRALIR